MTVDNIRGSLTMSLVVTSMLLIFSSVAAQTHIRPGFNLFSVEQDQDIGQQSAAEVEHQLPIVDDYATNRYIKAVGKRLAKVAPGAEFKYQFKVVNASDINAFALPGGYMYLNRGLIEAAGSEGMLAGVMAHEMAHVALRHGTNQASKAYLGQAGLGILGGLIAGDSSSTQKTVNAVGGFGMNALFLKFSRTDEEQADIVGAQMMAKARYDPMDMVAFFKMLESEQQREPSKVEQFFSSHPTPGDRVSRVRDEVRMLKVRPRAPVGGFERVKSGLRKMAPARSIQQIAKAGSPAQAGMAVASTSHFIGRAASTQNVAAPSSQFLSFRQRRQFFTIDYPQNWNVYEPAIGSGVTIAPDGGFLETGGAQRDLIYGVIVNHYEPFNSNDDTGGSFADSSTFSQGFLASGGPGSSDRTQLAAATNDLLSAILRANRNLTVVPDSQRNSSINGSGALSLVLSGRSPVTQEDERVTLFTRELADDHVIYALFIAPARDYNELRPTFDRMVSSLRINDEAAHR